MMSGFWIRLRACLQKGRSERDMDNELRFHLERQIEENVRHGMNQKEARFAALRSFGGVEQVKEVCRETRGIRWLDELWQDLRYGLRMLRKNPGFTAVAVIILALGIGSNTAIFSFVNAIFLHPLPAAIRDPARLVWVFATSEKESHLQNLSYPEFQDYQDQHRVFSGLMAFKPMVQFSLRVENQTERVWGALVSGNFLSVLGVATAPGRSFLAEEDQTPNESPVVIISHRLWQRRFGGNLAVIGKTVELNRHPYAIVGIAPEGFTSPIPGVLFDVYVPLMMQAQVAPAANLLQDRNQTDLEVMGRLAPGVTLEQAQAALQTLAHRLQSDYPKTNQGRRILVTAATRGNPKLIPAGLAAAMSGLIMAVAGLALLTACANIANMLLARAAARQKEIVVRAAVGASRSRLVRQLLTESFLLSLSGGAAGMLLAFWTLDLMPVVQAPINFPLGLELRLDGRVLGFAVILSLLTGVVFGLTPALHASKPDLVAGLKEHPPASARRTRLLGRRQIRVALQVGMSLVLLVVAGLFLRGLWHARNIHPGFEAENCLMVTLDPKLQDYSSSRCQRFYEQLQERLRVLPGVRAACLARTPPLMMGWGRDPVFIPGYQGPDSQLLELDCTSVGRDYFRTLGIPLLRGRDFSADELRGEPAAAIINETMARRYWPKQDALGQSIRFFGPHGPLRRVIGIVRDSNYYSLGEARIPYAFLPRPGDTTEETILFVRTASDPEAAVPLVRREVQALDRNMPLFEVKTLAEHVSRSLDVPRGGSVILTVFGFLTLALATVGIYGLASYSVKQRTHEIGIRLALGAQQNEVLKHLLRESMVMVLAGIGFGLVAAIACTRFLASALYGISAADPLVYGTVTSVLFLAALAACYWPLRRATRVDPMVALRVE
ncbi:MAG: ABC transporter permease [Acidobacteriia bacterium]|nr:ABC transporter permease [Terriglobia bacterium]